jgi:hypothetical protein
VPAALVRVAQRMPNIHLAQGDGRIAWDVATARARHLKNIFVAN